MVKNYPRYVLYHWQNRVAVLEVSHDLSKRVTDYSVVRNVDLTGFLGDTSRIIHASQIDKNLDMEFAAKYRNARPFTNEEIKNLRNNGKAY